MATLNDFLPHVMPYVPACPQPAALAQIRLAIAELCAQTRCWRHLQVFTVSASNYSFTTPAGSEIHEIESVSFEGQRLSPVPYGVLTPEDLAEEAPPQFFTQVSPDNLSIVPFAAGEVTAVLFLKPSAALSVAPPVIPDFILFQHGQVVGDGAVSRLKAMPGQPYSDPQGSAVHGAAFQQALDRLFSTNISGQHRAQARTRPRYF